MNEDCLNQTMRNHVPLSAKIALLINGSLGLIPLFLLLFGLFLSYGLLQSIDIPATIYLTSDTEIGKGRVVNVFETSFSVNEEPIYGYDYIFDSPVGPLEWTSYGQAYFDVGQEVDIEYNKDTPEINRIAGTTSSLGGVSTFLFTIPSLVGLVWLLINIKNGRKKIRVISGGKIGRGELKSKEPTNSSVNDQTVYKLTFSFKAEDGQSYQVSAKTHKTHKLEDEHEEILIYDPMDPNNAYLADNLPWGVPRLVKQMAQ